MSLADALIPQIPEHSPVDAAYLPHDVEPPAPIDQDEEMDDLFDEDAVVDHAERCSISPSAPYYNHLPIIRGNSLTDTRPFRTVAKQTRFLMPNSVTERRWNTRRRKTSQIRIMATLC